MSHTQDINMVFPNGLDIEGTKKNNFIKQKLSVRILSAQNWAWSARSSSTQLLKAASMDFMSAFFDLSWWRSTNSDIDLPRACGRSKA